MPGRKDILQQLADSRNLAVEPVIAAALEVAAPEEQHDLVDILLQRNHRAGWVTLIRLYDRLIPTVQEKLLSRPRDLFGPLAESMQESDGPTRENIIEIVRRCADGRLVYLLAEALIDVRPEVRELAGSSLLEAVRKFIAPDSTVWETKTGISDLRRAIEFSLRQYRTHRQVPTILAALISERQQDGSTWAHFQDPHGEATRAATAFLRTPEEPGLALPILLGLASPLKAACMAGLASIDALPTRDALLRESFRLIDPAIRDGAQAVTHLKILNSVRKDLPWNQETWSAWLRLIETVGIQPAQRLTFYTDMIANAPTDAIVWKLSLARAVAETGVPEAGESLARLSLDSSPIVARSAARYLLSKHRTEWRAIAAHVLPKSPHESVRLMAAGLLPARNEPPFDRVWNSFPQMPPAVQNAATRIATQQDPDFAEQLRSKLASTAPLDLAQGLKMLSAINDLVPYRGQIIALCGHVDARIAAIAVRLLGRLEDPKLKDLLEAATLHPDSRVRANAIESMESLHIASRSQQVLAMLNSRHNRERANAIKAISQFDFNTASDCLSRMLSDSNPMHRISALWVVNQLKFLDMIRQVSSIARRDPNLRVRRRAAEMMETVDGNANAPA